MVFHVASVRQSSSSHHEKESAGDSSHPQEGSVEKVFENLASSVVFVFYASKAMCIVRELADQTNLLLVR